MLLMDDLSGCFALFPRNVLLGNLRDGNKTPVWAAFQSSYQIGPNQSMAGNWRMCFYDDDLTQIKLPTSLSGDVEFAVAFQLLAEDQDTDKSWLTKVATCACVALIDSGHQEGQSFKRRKDASPNMLVALIKANWSHL
jgi:hypothetical protein